MLWTTNGVAPLKGCWDASQDPIAGTKLQIGEP